MKHLLLAGLLLAGLAGCGTYRQMPVSSIVLYARSLDVFMKTPPDTTLLRMFHGLQLFIPQPEEFLQKLDAVLRTSTRLNQVAFRAENLRMYYRIRLKSGDTIPLLLDQNHALSYRGRVYKLNDRITDLLFASFPEELRADYKPARY